MHKRTRATTAHRETDKSIRVYSTRARIISPCAKEKKRDTNDECVGVDIRDSNPRSREMESVGKMLRMDQSENLIGITSA